MASTLGSWREKFGAAMGERARALAGSAAIRKPIARVEALSRAAAARVAPLTAPAWNAGRAWFAKREPREKLLLRVLAGAVGVLLLYDLVYVPFAGLGGDIQDRVAVRQRQLIEVRGMMRSYQRLRMELAASEKRTVPGKDFSLFSVIEQSLTKTLGREKIGSITPSDRPVPGGFHQHAVDLKLTSLSLPQIVDTLYGLQTLAAPVTVSSLHIHETAQGSHAYDVDLTCMALGRDE